MRRRLIENDALASSGMSPAAIVVRDRAGRFTSRARRADQPFRQERHAGGGRIGVVVGEQDERAEEALRAFTEQEARVGPSCAIAPCEP